MLGRIRYGSGRRIVLRKEQIFGISVLTVELPQTVRKPKHEIKRAAKLLRKNRVIRVLTSAEFPWWPLLEREGLRPVETGRLRCILAPIWVTAQLKRLDIPSEVAVLCLKGERWEPVLERLSRDLCPLVRSLVFDIPGGEEVANRLRREMGIPILPRDFAQAHLTLRFDDGPVLNGAEITLSGREVPADCDAVELISVLWENGRIKGEEIVLKL